MKKRLCIRLLLPALLFLAGCTRHLKEGSSDDHYDGKPNIIFLLTDDQRWDALGVAGNPIVKTPNIDALAREGLMFRNAYVTTSICAISRASILSGEYESRHKINDFGTDFSPDALANTYPLLLKKAGYRIGYINKFGVGRINPPSIYFDYWKCPKEEQPDYLMKRADGTIIHNTDSVANAIKIFLDQFGKQEPFCLSVGFKAPHEQDGNPPRFIPQARYQNLYNDVIIPKPVTADPIYWNRFPTFFRTDQNIARQRWKALLSTDALFQENVKNYYRLITGVDEVVGNLINQLKELDIADHTIIIYMGDNGMYLGEHGLEGKWYGHEESIRVPLIVYDPLLPSQQRRGEPDQIALNIDIAPTIVSLAGLPIPGRMQGKNLLSIANGSVPPRKDFFYEHTYLNSPTIPQTEGVVTQDFKYLRYIENGYEQLYNVATDRYETVNLAFNRNYRDKLAEMRKRYMELKKAVQ
ncbi:MAG: sulfatase [Williamsia sp.]|nr:sulfatase [Williamsia sp.]